MKGFISSTLLVVASFSGAAAAADSLSSSAPRDVLAELSASLQDHADTNGDELRAGAGDFADALACTADLSTGEITDEADCATATDAGGAPCIWCDASAVLGQGVCVSSDIKSMAGQFWDQLCADDDAGPAPAPPVPATPPPTPAPTPHPTEPAPAPVPVPDDDNVPDALKCSVDAQSNLITDESTCVAKKDSTSATGENCVWCSVPVLGGSCITNSEKSSVSFLCSAEGDRARAGGHLRGNVGGGGDGWKALDPSCLGDGLAGETRESCGARVDSDGEKCVWCDAGDDVFGICATPSQKGYIGSYMDCADGESAPVVAVE